MSEAERAREIMRRHRRRSAEPAAASAPESAAVPEPVTGPAPEPVTGFSPEPSSATSPGPRSGVRADAHATAPAGTPEVVARWAEILEALRSVDLSAWIAARDAVPTAGEPAADGVPVVVLYHHTGALATFINNPTHAAAYAAAAEQTTGTPVKVHAVVGMPPEQTASPGNTGPNGTGNPESEQFPVHGSEPVPGHPLASERDSEPAAEPEPESGPEPVTDGSPSHQRLVQPTSGVRVNEGGNRSASQPATGSASESAESAPVAPPAAESPTDPVSIALARAKAQGGGPAPEPSTVTPAPTGASAATPSPAATRSRTSDQNRSDEGRSRDNAEELTGWRARMARNSSRQAAAATAADNGFDGVPLPEEPGEPWDDGYDGQQNGPAGPGTAGQGGAEQAPYDRRAEAEEALAQLDDPTSGNLDHRSALEIAGELLEQHLGAERTR